MVGKHQPGVSHKLRSTSSLDLFLWKEFEILEEGSQADAIYICQDTATDSHLRQEREEVGGEDMGVWKPALSSI